MLLWSGGHAISVVFGSYFSKRVYFDIGSLCNKKIKETISDFILKIYQKMLGKNGFE